MNHIMAFTTEREWIANVLEEIKESLIPKVQEGKVFRLGFSGGTTPGKIYEALSKLPLAWNLVELFLVDERMVPLDHRASNYRMIEQSFVSKLSEPLKKFVFFQTGLLEAETLLRYESEIGSTAFDLIILGIGSDGHTASLFPHGPELHIRDRFVTKSFAKNQDIQERFTLTFPVLESAHEIFFLLKGIEKRAMIQELESSKPENSLLPAAKLFHKPSTKIFFCEE